MVVVDSRLFKTDSFLDAPLRLLPSLPGWRGLPATWPIPVALMGWARLFEAALYPFSLNL